VKVSVIIPTLNRRRDLEECIKSLLNMSVRPHEIIVVDSSSTDETEKLKETYPIKYIKIDQRNRQIARNVGISIAKGNVLAFTDDDVVVDVQWLNHFLKSYSDYRVGGVGGRVIPYFENKNYYRSVRHFDVGKVQKNGLVYGNFDTSLPKPMQVDTLQGSNMSFRKDLLIKVGGFDENLGGNCFRDDTDVCMQIRKLGFNLIFQSKALVWHKYHGRIADDNWIYWYLRNNTYFYLKNIFPDAKRYLPIFLIRQFFPPRDYVKKSEVRARMSVKLPIKIFKGCVDGLRTYLNIAPSRGDRN